MANVHRLILAVLLFWVGSAHALLPVGNGWKPSVPSNAPTYSTPQAACDAAVAWYVAQWASASPPDNTGTLQSCTTSGTTGDGVVKRGNGATYNFGISSLAACPAHSVLSGGGCKCDTGYEERDGQCKTPGSVCVDKAGQSAIAPGVTQEFSTAKPASTSGMFNPRKMCIESCQASGTPSYWACGGTKCTVHFKSATYTGSPCAPEGGPSDPPADPPPTPDAEKCPAGKVPGVFNGSNVCVTPGEAGSSSSSTSSGASSSSTTNADGTPAAGSGSGGSGGGSGSGSSGTTATTVCNGVNCTTTTTSSGTSTNGAGQTTTTNDTTTKTEPQSDYCRTKPKAKECVGNEETLSSFNGACAGGFTAKSDDAVLNAMAEEQYRRNCQLFDTTGAASQQYAVETAKTGDQTGDLPGNFTQDLSAGADMSDALGGGSCPSDQNIPIAVGGRTFTLSLALSKSCQGLEWLGIALVAATAIASAFIVFKD